ncbi:MAG: MFS transporter [Chloroflexia bacterium]
MAPPNSLSPREKRRGLATILADTFLMWAGFFMVVPLISVYYVDHLGWAAASIGLVLAIRQFLQQGLTPISGVLADRFGAKGLICGGLLLRTLGFASMSLADTFPLLVFSVVLAALGGSLFESPRQASIAAMTQESERGRYYSLSGVASGLGLTIGTQIGALLLPFSFSTVAVGAAACFFATFLVTLVFFPSVRVASEAGNLTHGIRLALHDRPFVIFTCLLMGYWFMWVQLSISLPLAAHTIGGTAATVSLVYAVNSAMTIFFQYPLLRLTSRWLRPLTLLILGILLMGLGLGAISLATTVPALLLCVVCFSTGGLLATPSQQTVTASLSNPVALGSYFGVSSLALAIGGGLGNLSGGLLYDAARQLAFPQLPWLVFCAAGIVTASGLMLLATRRARERVTQEQDLVLVVPGTDDEPTVQVGSQPVAAEVGDALEEQDRYRYG